MGESFPNNPGSFEELHRRCTSVFPMCFDGAKVMIQKPISSHFQISHTVTMSSMNTGYRFGTTYVGTNQLSEMESYPVLLGDTDAAGNTIATLVHQFGHKWRVKLESHIQKSKLAGAAGTVERRGAMSTIGVSVMNPNVVDDSGGLTVSYLRRITKNLDVGVECMNHRGPQVPGGTFSALSYAARYTAAHFVAAATLSSASTHFSYFHRQTPNIAFGCEFQMNRMHGEALTTLAYQADLPEEGVTFRASVDTNWTVGGVLEKRLSQALPFTLALSGMINHAKNAAKFGIGFIIG